MQSQDLNAINNSLAHKAAELQEIIKQRGVVVKEVKEEKTSCKHKKSDLKLRKEVTTLKNTIQELQLQEVWGTNLPCSHLPRLNIEVAGEVNCRQQETQQPIERKRFQPEDPQ